jgi:hypothetical protein
MMLFALVAYICVQFILTLYMINMSGAPLSTICQLYRDGLTKQKTQHNMCWTPLCANKDIYYKVNNT